MTKVKRSFLERLTGAKTVETDAYESENEMSIKPSVDFYEERETGIPTDSSPRQFSRESREEGSLSGDDHEGQLTIDVYQTDNDVVVKSTIAGVKPEDLDVSINNDMLTIRGERKSEEEIQEENYYYQECYWGSFSRSVILPVDVIADKIEASMKNGILTVRMPKAASNRSKKIQVRGF